VTLTYRWFRDGVEILGESGISHVLLASDKGHDISFQVLAKKLGYADVVRESAVRRIP